jgi:hypothetical protein
LLIEIGRASKKKHRIARITPSDFFLLIKNNEISGAETISDIVLVSVQAK